MRKKDVVYHVFNWVRKKNWTMFRLCLVFVLFFQISTFAESGAQNQVVNLNLKNVSYYRLFDEIHKQTGLRFIYNTNQLEKMPLVNILAENKKVGEVLHDALASTPFECLFDGDVVMLVKRESEPQKKSVKVKGFVYDAKRTPLPGVTVKLVGTSLGTATNEKGWFVLELPILSGQLEFSSIGYKRQQSRFSEKTDTIRIFMEEEVSDLDEVVVVAYGERKKRELISAVSTVKADDIKEIPTSSFVSLLQGRMAGVEITNQSGAPGGGGVVVAIRGYNSLFDDKSKSSDGTPLYVVDGVPMHSFTSPITGTNALAELDPSTIESIEVLKDAASAAIYGSRAGNGVVLITTKKGKQGEAKFSANISYSASHLLEGPFQLGGRMERDYQLWALRSQREAYYDAATGMYKYPTSYDEAADNYAGYDFFWNYGYGQKVVRWLQDSINPFYNNATDWYRQMFRTGKVLNANIQASGGSERFLYMLGAGYYKERGIMQGSDFARVNFISNMTVRPVNKLRIDSRVYLAYTDRSRGPGSNSLVGAQSIESLTSDPTTTSTLLPATGEVTKELLKKLNGTVAKEDDYRLRANLTLGWMPIDGLNISVSGAVDYGQSNSNIFEPSYLDSELNMNKSTGNIARNIMLQNENMINYKFDIKNEHNFDILLGLSLTKNQSFSNVGYGRSSGSDLVYYVGMLQSPVYNRGESWGGNDWISLLYYTSSFEENTMLSYYGRIAYNYKQRYLMEATLRRDGSSVFGENKRYAVFPSVAVGWAFSEEKWVKENLPWLSYGKIRLSWGTSGQVFNSNYLAHGLMKEDLIFNGKQGMTSEGIINKDLTWEESDQYDIGLDMDFLDYRLKFKLDYYYKYTKSLLYEVELPGNVYGADFQDQNAMEVSNEGLELELQADIFRETAVKWRTRFNISRNWNRFEKSYIGTDVGSLVVGKPLAGLYLYDDAGFYSSEKQIPVYFTADGGKNYLSAGQNTEPFAPGLRIIKDLNGDGKITQDDRYYAGATYPLATGGWVNEIIWKNFDLNVLFTFSLGRKIVPTYGIRSLGGNPTGSYPLFEDIRGKEFANGTNANADYQMPGFYQSEALTTGMLRSNMERVSWGKLKQLTLGYNLEKSIVKKLRLSGVRVFITGENLFTLTNYSGVDPEVVSIKTGVDELRAYPLARKWTVGLTVNF